MKKGLVLKSIKRNNRVIVNKYIIKQIIKLSKNIDTTENK